MNLQVGTGWLVQPATSGEVVVNGLSVGNHYFACSVDDHCVKGMRLTVAVESGTKVSSQEIQVSSEAWELRRSSRLLYVCYNTAMCVEGTQDLVVYASTDSCNISAHCAMADSRLWGHDNH